MITVACLSISGHAHNSLSCNLVIKQLTFLSYSTTNNEYGYLHSSDRRGGGREDGVDKLIRKGLKHCQLFLKVLELLDLIAFFQDGAKSGIFRLRVKNTLVTFHIEESLFV